MNWSGVLRGSAVALATGAMTALGDYTQTHSWEAAGITGSIALCAYVVSHLSVNGAVIGISAAKAQATKP